MLQSATTSNISMGLRYGMTVIGGVAILFYTSWRLTVVMLSVMPIIVLCAVVYGRALRRLSRKVQDALARSTEVAAETLAGIRTVRAFAREDREAGRYGDAVGVSYDLARSRARASAVFQGVLTFAAYGAIAGVLWYGGVLVLRDQLKVGDLTAFILYTLTVAFAFGAVSDLWGEFMRAAGASERLFELLDARPKLVPGKARPEAVRGAVALREVHFNYPARPDMPVLRGLDLALSPARSWRWSATRGPASRRSRRCCRGFMTPSRARCTWMAGSTEPRSRVAARAGRRRIARAHPVCDDDCRQHPLWPDNRDAGRD